MTHKRGQPVVHIPNGLACEPHSAFSLAQWHFELDRAALRRRTLRRCSGLVALSVKLSLPLAPLLHAAVVRLPRVSQGGKGDGPLMLGSGVAPGKWERLEAESTMRHGGTEEVHHSDATWHLVQRTRRSTQHMYNITDS